MTSILINKPWGLIHQQCPLVVACIQRRPCLFCCLSPTVPDLCCSARMPWHLPDTIVPSCLERWRQCGMILKGIWVLEMHRKENVVSNMWTGTQLFHIYSCVCQGNERAKSRFVQTLAVELQKDGMPHYSLCLLLPLYARLQPKSENTWTPFMLFEKKALS